MKINIGYVSELPGFKESEKIVCVPGEEAFFPFSVKEVVEVGVFSAMEVELLAEPLKSVLRGVMKMQSMKRLTVCPYAHAL